MENAHEKRPSGRTSQQATWTTEIQRVRAHTSVSTDPQITLDTLAVEEPLEIRIDYAVPPARTERARKSVSITMRTPGHDFELAIGFLFTEGLLRRPEDVERVEFCGPSGNVVRVDLKSDVVFDLKRLERHFYTSSSCGVCGKSSIEALAVQSPFAKTAAAANLRFDANLVHGLPAKLREAQGVFDSTGGLHASALFDRNGELLLVREDVGRHNALDKVIGHAFLKGWLPLADKVLLVSGRASFELVQKAAVAGLPVLAAVGAPSSLAVELARERGMSILGFVRENRFNIYNGAERVVGA